MKMSKYVGFAGGVALALICACQTTSPGTARQPVQLTAKPADVDGWFNTGKVNEYFEKKPEQAWAENENRSYGNTETVSPGDSCRCFVMMTGERIENNFVIPHNTTRRPDAAAPATDSAPVFQMFGPWIVVRGGGTTVQVDSVMVVSRFVPTMRPLAQSSWRYLGVIGLENMNGNANGDDRLYVFGPQANSMSVEVYVNGTLKHTYNIPENVDRYFNIYELINSNSNEPSPITLDTRGLSFKGATEARLQKYDARSDHDANCNCGP